MNLTTKSFSISTSLTHLFSFSFTQFDRYIMHVVNNGLTLLLNAHKTSAQSVNWPVIFLLSQQVWGQLLVLGSLHSQSTVDENCSLRMLNRQMHRKSSKRNKTSFNRIPLVSLDVLWNTYSVCFHWAKIQTPQSIQSGPLTFWLGAYTLIY